VRYVSESPPSTNDLVHAGELALEGLYVFVSLTDLSEVERMAHNQLDVQRKP
jgi:hypothetical protein